MKRKFANIALIGSALLVLAGCADTLVSHFAFVPGKATDADRLPADPNLSEHFFPSGDGTRLHAITVDHARARHHILYLHGNAGHAFHRLHDVRQLSEAAEARVMLLDYRGYGKSEGHANEQGVYQDAEAALSWMEQHWKVPSREVIVVGRSLGTAIGIELAIREPVAGLVLVSPFESGLAMASAMGLGIFKGLVDKPFDSIGKVSVLNLPVLFIHGDRDRVVPISQGRALFDAYSGQQKRFVEIQGGGHNDIVPFMGQRYFQVIAGFAQEIRRQMQSN